MSGYTGALPHVVLSWTLWLIVAPPLLAFIWAVMSLRASSDAGGALTSPSRSVLWARQVAVIGSVLLSIVATLAHLAALRREPGRDGLLLEYLARGARVGSVDGALALSFDRLTGLGCILSAVVALLAITLVLRRPPADGGLRVWAWIEFSLAAALLSFLADGLVTMALGWALAAVGTGVLAGWTRSQEGVWVATRSVVALTALLAGGVLLFWGFGDTWVGEDYRGHIDSGYVPVRVASWDDEPAALDGPRALGGKLTLTDAPGTQVFFDDAKSPAMTSPFARAVLPANLHMLRLKDGAATRDVRLPVRELGGASWVLVPAGPTLSFRVMNAIVGIRSDEGDFPFARALAERMAPAGSGLLTSALVLWIFAAWVMSGHAPPGGAPFGVSAVAYGSTTAFLGPFLLARAPFLWASSPSARGVLVCVGATIIGHALLRKQPPSASSMSLLVPFFSVTPGALSWMALGLLGGLPTTPQVQAIVASAILVIASVGLVFLAARYPASFDASQKSHPRGRPTLTCVLVEWVPERLGLLLMSYERWVINAAGRAGMAVVRVAAWAAALADENVIAAPADGAAGYVGDVGQKVDTVFGGSFARIAWTAAVLVATVLGLTLWLRH